MELTDRQTNSESNKNSRDQNDEVKKQYLILARRIICFLIRNGYFRILRIGFFRIVKNGFINIRNSTFINFPITVIMIFCEGGSQTIVLDLRSKRRDISSKSSTHQPSSLSSK
eukprot:TCONS_00012477-protein